MVVIDDDDLSRELLALIAAEAGFDVESFASGDDAIAGISQAPAAVLTDMQMPGLSGRELAVRLRAVCGAGTKLLAMSGSKVADDELARYDGFLLKPFSADELKAAFEERNMQAAADIGEGSVMLNEAVFENFARSMPAGQVFGLYRMCLDDAGKRVATMRRAAAVGDDAAYRRAAHAIKGGCGMVGALELQKLASDMENAGLSAGNDVAPLDLFLAASERLGRMLDIKAGGSGENATAVRPL